MDIQDELRALIRQKIEAREEKQGALGRVAGLSPDKMSKFMREDRQLTAEEADKLARYFGLRQDSEPDPRRDLPIYPLVAAGHWRDAIDEIIGYMPSPDYRLSREAFVVIVEGDSMDKIAREGEAIIVEPRDKRLVHGKYYVVRRNGGETTFKRYFENPARLEPCSHNEAHQPIYPGEEPFEVVGRVVKRVEDL